MKGGKYNGNFIFRDGSGLRACTWHISLTTTATAITITPRG